MTKSSNLTVKSDQPLVKLPFGHTRSKAKFTSPQIQLDLLNPDDTLVLRREVDAYDSINYNQFFEFNVGLLNGNWTLEGKH